MTIDTRSTGNWSGVAGSYADTFAHLCAGTIPALLEHASLALGTEVLEVGSGSGLLATRIVAAGARLTAVEVDCVWRISPDLFWSALEAGIGGIGKALLQQSTHVRQRMRAAYDDLSLKLVEDGELVLPSRAVLVTARKPDHESGPGAQVGGPTTA